MKYALTYGTLAGLVIISVMLTGLVVADRGSFFASMWFGFLVMLVAMSFMFVGVKRYRDVEHGGVIRFMPAFLMGLAIAAVAALAYVLIWEIYLAATGYRFMDEYLAGIAEDLRAAGKSQAEVAREMAKHEWVRANYPNPLIRIPLTFTEIFPIGLLVALVSAALLRNPKVLPARG
jgi:small-conductance mechanosensitive channel